MRSGHLWGAALLVALPAHAEPSGSDKAAAEALFREGRALLSAEKFATACPKLAESQRLDPRMGTLLNLAICHEKEGKTASAWAEFADVATLAARQGEPEREKYAQERVRELGRRLSRLTVVVKSSDPVEVRLDGKVMGAAAWGTAIPVDPGPHALEASAVGKVAWSSRVEVPAGPADVRAEVPALADVASAAPTASSSSLPPATTAPAPSSAPAPTSAPVPGQATAPEGSRRATLGWVGVGVGLLGVGLGSYFGFAAISRRDDSRALCDATGCSREGQALQQDAIEAARFSTVSFAVGLVGGAAGVYLLLTPSRTVSLAPAVSPGLAGLRLHGAF